MENVQAGHVNNKHQEHLASECISTQWLKTTGNAQWLSELLATMQATAYTDQTRALRDQSTTCSGQMIFNFTGLEKEDFQKNLAEDEDESSGTSDDEYEDESTGMVKEAEMTLGSSSSQSNDVSSSTGSCKLYDFRQRGTGKLLPSDHVDTEIDADLGEFIQRLLITVQPEERLKFLYDKTHCPTIIPALQEIKLQSSVIDSSIMYAQNYMLKGITKVAYIMNAIYKNIDMVPAEMNLRSLMSNFNDAMLFFGAAKYEMVQQFKEPSHNHLSASNDKQCEDFSNDRVINSTTEIVPVPNVTIRIGYKSRVRQPGGPRYHPY